MPRRAEARRGVHRRAGRRIAGPRSGLASRTIMARGVLASLIPTPQRIGAAAGLRRTAAATRAEPGNRRCDLFRQADGVPGLHMLGIDGDEAAPEARRASAHSVAYRKRAAEWLAQPPAVTALTAVAAVSRRPGATTPCEPCCGGQAALVAIALRGPQRRYPSGIGVEPPRMPAVGAARGRPRFFRVCRPSLVAAQDVAPRDAPIRSSRHAGVRRTVFVRCRADPSRLHGPRLQQFRNRFNMRELLLAIRNPHSSLPESA